MNDKIYLCIDLKSFYASVECMERGLDPMRTNLIVADSSRTEKTICLAVSPSLKAVGISSRPRLFEVNVQVKKVNEQRRKAIKKPFSGKSCNFTELQNNPELELDFIIAPPQMAYYIKYSTRIYDIYLKYISPEDIHVYSIDEVFMDITNYLKTYKMTANDLAMKIIGDVLSETGITATAGIGTNMYLAKIAMDIKAKKMKADKNGVRIAELDERSYRKELWTHRPLTDFWRIGTGILKKLEQNGLYTMGDIAECSIMPYGEDKLYKLFGINAELLIDHAWGWEPCTIEDIRRYHPESKSISSGQVLHCPYNFEKAKIIIKEMTELLMLDLVEKKAATDQLVLTVGYDTENLTIPELKDYYKGEIIADRYGRRVPKYAHGTVNLGKHTSSISIAVQNAVELYEKIVDQKLLVRRINISANHVISESKVKEEKKFEQLDIFTDYEQLQTEKEREEQNLKKERAIAEATIDIKNKYGKNAILKGVNLKEGATAKDRNSQIGGHKA